MIWQETLYRISDEILFIPFIFLLLASILLSFKTNFIQIRMFGYMIQLLLKKEKQSKSIHTVHPRKALFTAMSTTIGISNIVGPIIAIGIGGPGALLGFILATFFGGATTFTEVSLALKYRKRFSDGSIAGGPMQYIKEALSPFFAFLYALFCVILYIAWTTNQSNQLSILLLPLCPSLTISGIIIAGCTIIIIVGGIKRIANFVGKIIPFMFILYTSGMVWIIACNITKLPDVFYLIITSAFSSQALAGGIIGTGLQQALRWGLAKALQSNECGLGTTGIAHSASSTNDPFNQGILAMISTYTNGLLCLLSGIAILITGVWQDPTLTFDITMINKAISLHFPLIGTIILSISAILFAFSTILGNSYIGTQCFLHLTKNRGANWYYLFVGIGIIIGSVSDVKFIWSIVDFFVIPVAIPNIIGIVILTFTQKHLLKNNTPPT